MAKLRFSTVVLEDLLFGYAANPVKISSVVGRDEQGNIVFDISGADVPDAEEVKGVVTLDQNRAGQRLMTMTFRSA